MKPALLGLAVGTTLAALALAFSGSCSVSHPSDQYACVKSTDCMGGRVCVGGFCIVPGTLVDAPRGQDGGRGSGTDAGPSCPGQCTSCNIGQKTCVIDCQLTSCSNTVACPAGYKCDIKCDSDGACTHGVNCQSGASCQVECSAHNACRGVQCGTGPCDVTCTGTSSCDDVQCGASCACDVVCTGGESCTNNVQCTSIACQAGSGCTSQPAFCHSCP